MSYSHRKTVTFALAQAGKAYRQRSAGALARLGLYPGQDQILKSLADDDGQSMSALAASLSVQPPTVTKMVSRLGAQGLVERRADRSDGRSASVFLTEAGRAVIARIDKVLRALERDALAGIEDKDRKRIRKVLRRMERNLGAGVAMAVDEDELPLEADEPDGMGEAATGPHPSQAEPA